MCKFKWHEVAAQLINLHRPSERLLFEGLIEAFQFLRGVAIFTVIQLHEVGYKLLAGHLPCDALKKEQGVEGRRGGWVAAPQA